MLRDHHLYIFTYDHHQAVRQFTAQDESHVIYENGVTRSTFRVLAPSRKLAECVFQEAMSSRPKEEKVMLMTIEDTGILDAFIQKHRYT
jgi:hypothetical protein